MKTRQNHLILGDFVIFNPRTIIVENATFKVREYNNQKGNNERISLEREADVVFVEEVANES